MKVVTLDKDTFQENCKALFNKFDHDFDLVVGIFQGGKYVLDVFIEHNKNDSIKFKTVTIQRDGTTGFKSNKMLRYILKRLPYSISNKLRVYEAKKLKRQAKAMTTNIEMDFDIKSSVKNKIKKVLILDDAIDSGHTMAIATKTITKVIPDVKIVTAVLSWTNAESIVKPNYFIYKDVLVRFPWSLDYKANDYE